MIADVFTKPLQGAKFKKFRDSILNVPGAEKIPLPGEIHAHNFVPISGQECVGTNVTSGTETCSHLDKSKIRPRTVKVRTPADQDWHEAKGRPRPGARINPRSGRTPGRSNMESEYFRPKRAK